MIRTALAGRIAPIAAGLTLWAAFATVAQALVINQVDGRFGVFCVEDTLELPCTNGRYQRSITQRGPGRQSASDSYESAFDTVFTGPPGVQHQNVSKAEWSATANTGRLSAGTYATLTAPAGDPVFSGQLSAATAESLFSDDWSILGPTDALRRIHVHFSLSGVINDLAGVALPFGRVYAGNGFAFARLSTTIGLDPGSNRFLGPIAIGPAGGMRERCIGNTGCGSVGSDSQGMD